MGSKFEGHGWNVGKTKNVLRVEVTDFAIVQVNCFKYRSVHGVPRIIVMIQRLSAIKKINTGRKLTRRVLNTEGDVRWPLILQCQLFKSEAAWILLSMFYSELNWGVCEIEENLNHIWAMIILVTARGLRVRMFSLTKGFQLRNYGG